LIVAQAALEHVEAPLGRREECVVPHAEHIVRRVFSDLELLARLLGGLLLGHFILL
jgi:hypothetical protein